MSDIMSPVNDEDTVQLNPESLVARIIAELQANPEAQSLLLRALLTNEFLGMPIRLERVEADIAQLKVDVAQLKVDVAHLKGDSLEVKLHRRIRPLLSQRLNLRRAQVMQSPVQDTHAELYEPIEAAFDEGRITDAQETRIHVTDLIIRAQRKTDRLPVWVAVDVSNEIHRRATWVGCVKRLMRWVRSSKRLSSRLLRDIILHLGSKRVPTSPMFTPSSLQRIIKKNMSNPDFAIEL